MESLTWVLPSHTLGASGKDKLPRRFTEPLTEVFLPLFGIIDCLGHRLYSRVPSATPCLVWPSHHTTWPHTVVTEADKQINKQNLVIKWWTLHLGLKFPWDALTSAEIFHSDFGYLFISGNKWGVGMSLFIIRAQLCINLFCFYSFFLAILCISSQEVHLTPECHLTVFRCHVV